MFKMTFISILFSSVARLLFYFRVNMDHYSALVNMGFPKKSASESLKQTNNDINRAIEVVNKSHCLC